MMMKILAIILFHYFSDSSSCGWWFQTLFIFHEIWDNHPNWRTHIFQRGRYTTNQSLVPCCCVINYVAQALPSDHSNPSVRENDMLCGQNKWSEPMHMSAAHIYIIIYIYIVTPRERQTHIRKQRTTNLNICKKTNNMEKHNIGHYHHYNPKKITSKFFNLHS